MQTKIYLSGRGWGEFSPVEWIGDISRSDAEIVAECRALLLTGHDVDRPNQSYSELASDIQKARREANAQWSPVVVSRKRGHGWCNRCESYCYGDCTSND